MVEPGKGKKEEVVEVGRGEEGGGTDRESARKGKRRSFHKTLKFQTNKVFFKV